ncbi:MAG: tetratricopeptide (TPR) repeat protein [Parvicellaceae bacterium]|jgi:tetratricopeptide (TPR) repeat protein
MKVRPSYSNKTVFVIITILCFIIYGNSLQNGYNFDDAWSFENKGETDLITGIQNSFSSTYVSIGELNYGYRPISIALFEVEQAIFGQKPTISHGINVLFYILVCYLLFIWLSKYVKVNWWLASIVTLIFIFLPIHSEVVNSIKNRDELLSALFGILFLIMCWKYYRKGGVAPLLIGFLCFILALLSKPNVVTFIAIVPLGLLLTSELNKKRLVVMIISPILLLAVATQSIKAVTDLGEIKNVHEVVENPLYGTHSGADKVNVAINSFGFYLTGLVSVHEFGAYYGLDTIDFLKLHVSYQIAVLIYVISLIVLLILYFKSRKYKLSVFALLFISIAILPFLNIFQVMPGVVGERLVFQSSIGFSLLIGGIIYHLLMKFKSGSLKMVKPLVIGLLAVATVFWVVKTVSRNNDWHSLESLMSADLEKYPKSLKMNMIMGSVQYNQGITTEGNVRNIVDVEKIKLARNHFSLALETFAEHKVALFNIAWMDTYILQGNPDTLQTQWDKLVELEVLDSAEVVPHMFNILELKGKTKEALDLSVVECGKGDLALGIGGMRIAVSKSKWKYVWELSQCLYMDEGQRHQKLIEMWKRLSQSDPEKAELLMQALITMDESPYYGKIRVQNLMLTSRFSECLELLNKLDVRFPNDVEIKMFYGNIYTSLNQIENALIAFNEALLLQPDNENLSAHIKTLQQ